MLQIKPAYGRDYKSANEARQAYCNGDDFILCDITSPWHGKPCSIRDFKLQPTEIRYNKLQSVVVVNTSQI